MCRRICHTGKYQPYGIRSEGTDLYAYGGRSGRTFISRSYGAAKYRKQRDRFSYVH